MIGAASDKFKPMLARSRYKALYGGRGSAKSHFFAEALIGCAADSMGFRAVCIREVQKTLRESAKRLLEDKIEAFGLQNSFQILNDRIVTPGGGTIIFQGMQDHTAESIKSLENFQVAWVEEAQTLSQKSLELLRPTIRSKGSELWFSWNPRSASDPVDKFFRGLTPPESSIIIGINYPDNKLFPTELEAERQHDYATNQGRYDHIWLGGYEPEAVGAIFNRANIHENRKAEAPELERIVIGIDPAVTDNENSDHHGIAVCGLGSDGRGYLLEDASLQGGPHQWATRAVAMFDLYEANAIVIEVNQGGDLLRHTLETVRKGIPIIEVRATKGKHVRAEPISALYAINKISHIGTFNDLENQLCVEEGTLIETDRGQVPIEDVTLSDRVMTRNGLALIDWCGYTGEASSLIEIETVNSVLRVTPCHPIYLPETNEFVTAESVLISHNLLESRKWARMASLLRGEVDGMGKCQEATIATHIQDYFTEKYLRRIQAQSLKASIFTTLTTILKTIALKTLSHFPTPIIMPCMSAWGLMSLTAQSQSANVSSAEQAPKQYDFTPANTVRKSAICGDTDAANPRQHSSMDALSAAKSLQQPIRTARNIALRNVRRVDLGKDTKRVYNITVAESGLPEYYANGILTHNCKFTNVGYDGDDSPDRAEAAIWAFTELFPALVKQKPKKQHQRPRKISWMG